MVHFSEIFGPCTVRSREVLSPHETTHAPSRARSCAPEDQRSCTCGAPQGCEPGETNTDTRDEQSARPLPTSSENEHWPSLSPWPLQEELQTSPHASALPFVEGALHALPRPARPPRATERPESWLGNERATLFLWNRKTPSLTRGLPVHAHYQKVGKILTLVLLQRQKYGLQLEQWWRL